MTANGRITWKVSSVIVKGKVFWARAKELFVWSPSFKDVPEKELFSDDESAKINEQTNNLNNDEVENASEVVIGQITCDNGEVQGFEQQHEPRGDIHEAESDQTLPCRSARSNSRVLEEAENSVDRVSSEVLVMAVKNQGRRFHFGDFRRNGLRWDQTMVFYGEVIERLLGKWTKVLVLLGNSGGWESIVFFVSIGALLFICGMALPFHDNSLCQGVDLIFHCKIRVEKVYMVQAFGKDLWFGDILLKLYCSCLFALEEHKGHIGLLIRWNTSYFLFFSFVMSEEIVLGLKWRGVFQVKDVRSMLDEAYLPKMEVPTRWINSYSIKVNVFVLDNFISIRLPIDPNLSP
ncbi:hypothetical protein Tco_0999280 [Tanacetum coccineum]